VKSVTNCVFNNHKNNGYTKDINLVTVGKMVTRTHRRSCRRNLITLKVKRMIININIPWKAGERQRERDT
jgi:hypothetical protein